MQINRLPNLINKKRIVNFIRFENDGSSSSNLFAAFKKPFEDAGRFLVTAVRIVVNNEGAGVIPDQLRFLVAVASVTEGGDVVATDREWRSLNMSASSSVEQGALTIDEIGCGKNSIGYGLQAGEIESVWRDATVLGAKNHYDVTFDLVGREIIVSESDANLTLLAGIQCATGETIASDSSNSFSVYYYGYYL